MDLTIHISAMVQHCIKTGPVSGVPDTDRVVPGTRDDQIGDLCVPQKAPHWCCVSSQDDAALVSGVVPHMDSSAREARFVSEKAALPIT